MQDTDNQRRKPYRPGRSELSGRRRQGCMISLCIAEIGGFLVLFAGLIQTVMHQSIK